LWLKDLEKVQKFTLVSALTSTINGGILVNMDIQFGVWSFFKLQEAIAL